MRKVLKAAAIAALVLTVAIAIPAVVFFRAMDSIFGGSSSVYPSDAAMLAHWRAQRPIMDELAAMLRADSRLDRIGADFTVPGDLAAAGIDAPRAARYRALMRAAGVLMASHFGRQIELVYYTQGFGPVHRAKSFVFGPAPNDYVDIVDGDLDAASKGRRTWYLERRIDGEWWLMSVG